jgi:hypothetical protein
MFYLLIAMIGAYLFGVLMGIIGLIHCIFNGRGVRALVIIVCLAGFTISTFYLSLPMLHMHGPSPDKSALSLAWIANIVAIIIFIRFAGRTLRKPNAENDNDTNDNITIR